MEPSKHDPHTNRPSLPGAHLALWEMALLLLWSVALALLLLLMCFFASDMNYSCKTSFLVPNWLLLIVAVGGCMLLRRGLWRLSHWTRPALLTGTRFDVALILLTVALFLLHVRICYSYVFVTGWDSGIITNAAWNIASNQPIDDSTQAYFSMYPNNLALLYIATKCMELALSLDARAPLYGVFACSVFNCISSAIATLLVYWALKTASSRAAAVAGWCGCFLLIWTSPWEGILYSDGLAVLFPAAEIALWVLARRHDSRRRMACWLALGLIAALGYSIKPQVIFPALAIVASELAWWVGDLAHATGHRQPAHMAISKRPSATPHSPSTLPRTIVAKGFSAAACAIVGVAVASAITGAAASSLPLSLDPNLRFGMDHFFMMGLNPDTRGVYSQEDVNLSASATDPSIRAELDRAVTLERLQAYGPAGLANLFAQKAMTNYNDGTFAWGVEGGFFYFLDQSMPQDWLSSITRSLYYPDGAAYMAWSTLAQLAWILQLALALVGAVRPLVDRRRSPLSPLVLVLSLSLLMLTVFELLFEARARYLFSSLPLYITLAAIGLTHCAKRRRPHHPAGPPSTQ